MLARVEKPRLAGALAALGRRAQIEIPRDSYARLLHAVESRRMPRTWRYTRLLVVTTGLSAIAGAVAVALLVSRSPRMCGFTSVAGSGDWHGSCAAGGEIAVDRGEATLALEELGVRVAVVSGTRVLRAASGVRVLAGRAVFSVEPRPRRSPVRVLVSHGVIEVVGTRFAVEQSGDRGSVRLETGSIRFESNDGSTIAMSAGQTLRWPLDGRPSNTTSSSASGAPPPSAPRVRSGDSTVRSRATTSAGTADLVRRIERMRIQHDYDRLAAWLGRTLAGTRSEPLRERLSFEMADVLIKKGAPPAEVCGHIERHVRRYASGEYTEQLTRTLTELRCPR